MDIDLLVDKAWPALERVELDGWTLRHAEGVTKRANSVLVTGDPADLDDAIDAAEAFYAARGLPSVFSLGQGAAGLDPVLEARGYRLVDPVLAMVSHAAPSPVTHQVRIQDTPWQGWLESWWAVDGRYGDGLEVAAKICSGVPAWYAAVEEDGVALAVGRGVPQGDTLGVYCMATLPRARRRGLARSVLRALVRHAGLASVYLVVQADNTAAGEFYRSEGFADRGGYHYRVK
ncbi:GNAT family N-acetyltransferase [Nonomuraea sp. NPDC059194]|uniref:GNAT family N-acetyltransferase n=1 Tax=Nonomuraea sp. NPDC059194 TaxID=3346764 RepID=UPI00368A03F3